MSIKILGIETSCDDSSMSVLEDGKILSNVIYSQKIHEKYGGVVPEWASRKHVEAIVPLFHETLERASSNLDQFNAIAVTQGPGLIGSLMVGIGFAKGLSLSTGLPLITVNHLEAHVISLLIDEPRPSFPFICLTVSGGHTQLLIVRGFNDMELIGSTIDDAAGEAFDKTGKLLGLPYPAGPHMDKLAAQGKPVFTFPISNLPEYNFSFSGIKTSVLYFLKKKLEEDPYFISKHLNDICASIQHSIIEMLLIKVKKLSDETGITQIGIAGGVSANSGLRNKLNELSVKLKWDVYYPQLQYCTDNAAMIAYVAYHKFLQKDFATADFEAKARFL
ncbi:MAG: tRNA (adenosine(37)-N6)-threonylcarbamoyltransferase complex transferase subunit TsaD [Saprospiraceae bacterium]|nr:tRNA (adenosine(37)-N6)-threonylcarbamoyltransferase complex transferase subunit TsaD [Saprospiraceae bacterium]